MKVTQTGRDCRAGSTHLGKGIFVAVALGFDTGSLEYDFLAIGDIAGIAANGDEAVAAMNRAKLGVGAGCRGVSVMVCSDMDLSSWSSLDMNKRLAPVCKI